MPPVLARNWWMGPVHEFVGKRRRRRPCWEKGNVIAAAVWATAAATGGEVEQRVQLVVAARVVGLLLAIKCLVLLLVLVG